MKIIKALFDNMLIYDFFSKFVSTEKTKVLLNNTLRLEECISVVDFGCGLGFMADNFVGAKYIGIDPLPALIRQAQKRLECKPNVEFIVGDQNILKNLPSNEFDLLFGVGVLHHMSDSQIEILQCELKRILTKNGRVFFWEPNLDESTRKLERFFIKLDRGQMARSAYEYLNLLGQENFNFSTQVHRNLLRIPYDILIIQGLVKPS